MFSYKLWCKINQEKGCLKATLHTINHPKNELRVISPTLNLMYLDKFYNHYMLPKAHFIDSPHYNRTSLTSSLFVFTP